MKTKDKIFERPIYVTQPFLPPLEEYQQYLEEIWRNKYLTNSGPFHNQLEEELAKYLGVEYVSLFANGTLALITALQALRITGDAITTPYSFVATAHSLMWNGIRPIFCDIDPITKNIDPKKIEASITPRTTAIIPVHIYGNPCNVDSIQQIADVYGLKVIYDAAHALGVKIDGKSILTFGDLSVLSFHATKIFNTFEGGAIISKNIDMKNRIDHLKNFGFHNEISVVGIGINGKMSEVQAAMGLLQLKYLDDNIAKRRKIFDKYIDLLRDIDGIRYNDIPPGFEYNYSYFPIFIDKMSYGKTRDELYELLRNNDVYGRRYFYPLISHFSTYKGLISAEPKNLPFAERVCKQVICLPIYPDLRNELIENIAGIIANK